jgi:hypothetical protein
MDIIQKTAMNNYDIGYAHGVNSCQELINKLQADNAKMRGCLKRASEYHRTDDVNGEAGKLCFECLQEIGGGE